MLIAVINYLGTITYTRLAVFLFLAARLKERFDYPLEFLDVRVPEFFP